MAKRKLKKNKAYKFYGFNIKLLSDERGDENAYFNLIKDVYEKDLIIQTGTEKSLTLRSQHTSEFNYSEIPHKILYGKLVKFTMIHDSNWYNIKKREFVDKLQLPPDVYPNGFEIDYIFIPAAHRFYTEITSKISVGVVQEFLIQSLKQVRGLREDVSVHLIQSQDVIDKIIESDTLKALKINVTYTNQDIGKEAQEVMDKLLRDGQVGELDATLKPDQHENMKTDSTFIRGLLEVAKENGTAEATILNDEGEKEKINTSEYPEKKSITADANNIYRNLFFEIMREYRDEQ